MKESKPNYYLFYYELILNLLNIALVNLITTKISRNLHNYYSEIHLVVQGSGYQYILYNYYDLGTFEVLVNGVKDDSCNKKCDLQGDKNNVTLRIQNQITSCYKMFYELNNIIEIDLSNFDASKVKTMYCMFHLCSNLQKINFGNINTSSLEDLYGFVATCPKLTSLNLSKFNTSNVKNMRDMFYECPKLENLDLSNFNTSNVIDMAYMFYKCSNLKYLDLSNFITSKVTDIEYMFYDCSSLIFLNLYSFKLKNSVDKNSAFNFISPNVKYCVNDEETELFLFNNVKKSDCSDICFKKNIIIDIINNKCMDSCSFNENKYKYNNECYKECPKDTFIFFSDLNNNNNKIECHSEIPQGYYLDINSKTIKSCFKNCKLCNEGGNEAIHDCKECKSGYIFLNEAKYKTNWYEICNYFYYFDKLNEYHCDENCPEEYKKIKDKKKCIDDCKNDNIYQYEYKSNCFKKCPNNAYLLENDKNKKCYDNVPDGYYLDKENEIYKKCYENCNKCDIGGNDINNNCKDCKIDYSFYKNNFNITNCYKTCPYYYYFDKDNNYHCTDNFECPLEYNKLISNKSKCVSICKNDDIYQYEYKNICYKECPEETIKNENDYICYENKKIETTFINEIKETKIITYSVNNDIEGEAANFKGMISDFNVSENQEDIIEKKDNYQFQMTTSDNQKNNTNKNMSSIDLGDCESKLKEIYKIDPSLPLIIFKIDYFSKDSLIPIIGYEIYHPLNKSKLDLIYCEDILIKLNIPVNIDEDTLFKYDPNSDFYNDNCFSYTTENGTDIILTDRKQEFSNNKLSLCENHCNYTGYDENNKQSSCDCSVKNKMETVSELSNNSNSLSNNFDTKNNELSSSSSNIISIKCTKALFSKDGLKKNISSYIIAIFIIYFLLMNLYFIKCGYPLLIKDINQIIAEKERIKNKMAKNNQLGNRQTTSNINKNRKKFIKRKINFPPKNVRLNFVNHNNNKNFNLYRSNNRNNKIQFGRTSNINRMNKFINRNNRNLTRHINTITNNKSNRYLKSIQKLKLKQNTVKIKYNDYELNTFNYIQASLRDKRNCFEYYISLIKRKNPIIFSFCPIKDYNTIIIKSCIFNISFSIYYVINFAFFNDKIIHDIYEIGGKYNIIYFIPKISISFGIGYYITTIIKIIFLSERNIVHIRRQITPNIARNISNKEKKNLVIKYVMFFILGYIFFGFLWMLLSSFGAVYPNTQMFIIKNTLISFAMSIIYPFFISIFPCIFRMCSLKSKESECAYKISKFLQIL